MFSIIGHWLYGAILSWGGLAGLIAVIAWVLWFLTPRFLLTYKSQLLHIAIGATVFMVAYTYAYNAGFAECKSAWSAANLKVAQEKADLAASIRKQAEGKVQAANDELQKQSDSFQRQIDDYEKRLATRQGGSCPLTADDLSQLRNIK